MHIHRKRRASLSRTCRELFDAVGAVDQGGRGLLQQPEDGFWRFCLFLTLALISFGLWCPAIKLFMSGMITTDLPGIRDPRECVPQPAVIQSPSSTSSLVRGITWSQWQRCSLCILNNDRKESITVIVMTTEMAVAKEFASYLNKVRHPHWALQVNQCNVISFRSLRHNDQ